MGDQKGDQGQGGAGGAGQEDSAEDIRRQVAELERASPRDQAKIDEAKRRLADAERREAAGS